MSSVQGSRNSRSVYLPVIRQAMPAMLKVFDVADPSLIVGRRDVTTVPTQALFLMNNPIVKRQAAAVAARIEQQVKQTGEDRVERLWLTVLNRSIIPDERRAVDEFLLEGDDAWVELCHALLASNEFLMRL